MDKLASLILDYKRLNAWIKIVSYLFNSSPGSVIHAWLVLRQVSHLLKSATECAFKSSEHIKLLGCKFHSYPGHPFFPKSFRFQSVEGDRLIFEEKDRDPHDQQDADEWLGGMKAALGNPSYQDPHSPPYLITLNPIAINDTELTGLELDKDKRQISVLWKPMITKLIVEEYRIARRLMILNGHAVRSRHPFSGQQLGFYRANEIARKLARACRYGDNLIWSLALASIPVNPTFTAWTVNYSRIAGMWYKDWDQLRARWRDIENDQEGVEPMYHISRG